MTDNPHASDATPEVIDSSRMQVLAEFEYADEIVNNADRFRVGVLGSDVIIREHGLDGTWGGVMIFERANAQTFVEELDNLLKGGLWDADNGMLGFIRGKDTVGMSIPSPRGELHVIINNNRRVRLDDLEWMPYFVITPNTARRLRSALEQLLQQGNL